MADAVVTPIQCKLGRTAVGYGLRDLAAKANVSPNTISRLERGENMHDETLVKVRKALEKAGVRFIAENGGGLGVRLSKTGRKTRR